MTFRFSTLILALAALASFPTTLHAQTQAQINSDACSAYKKADAALNDTYKKIQTEYSKDTLFLQKLKSAQRAWVAYRDAHLEALYPAVDKQAEYGSMYTTCRCAALQEVTEQRTKELQKWLDGVPEGETCRGSLKSATK
jgi:uncharacterized protein YecT (DUF1311 family)